MLRINLESEEIDCLNYPPIVQPLSTSFGRHLLLCRDEITAIPAVYLKLPVLDENLLLSFYSTTNTLNLYFFV
jgi:hypothetical protein